MSTDPREQAIVQACERLHAARADVSDAMRVLRSGHSDKAANRGDPGEFPRSALMRAAASRNGHLVLGAVALGMLAMRPGLIPIIWRIGRVIPVLPLARSLLNRYLVRRNATFE
jgi:hypothetical protein